MDSSFNLASPRAGLPEPQRTLPQQRSAGGEHLHEPHRVRRVLAGLKRQEWWRPGQGCAHGGYPA